MICEQMQRRNHRILTVSLGLMVLLAGCSIFGSGDGGLPDGATTVGGADQTDTGDGTGQTNGTSADDDANRSDSGRADASGESDGAPSDLQRVMSNHTETLREAGSFTLVASSEFRNKSSRIRRTHTVRANAEAERYLLESRTESTAQKQSIREAIFSDGDVSFIRHTVGNRTVYERQDLETTVRDIANRSRATTSTQFEFEHSRTDEGDHLFTADSVDQFIGDQPERGTLESVSAVVVVDDDTGIVQRSNVSLVITRDSQRVTVTRRLSIENVGTTSVPEPAWLATAKDRT